MFVVSGLAGDGNGKAHKSDANDSDSHDALSRMFINAYINRVSVCSSYTYSSCTRLNSTRGRHSSES